MIEEEITVENVDQYIAKLDTSSLEEMSRLDDLIDEIVEQLEKKNYLRKDLKPRPVKILLKRRFDKDMAEKRNTSCKAAFTLGWKEGYKEGVDPKFDQKMEDEEFARLALEALHKRFEALRFQKTRSDLDFNAHTSSIVKHMRENKQIKENPEPKDLAGVHSIISRRYAKFLKSQNLGQVHRAYQIGWKVGYLEARKDLRLAP